MTGQAIAQRTHELSKEGNGKGGEGVGGSLEVRATVTKFACCIFDKLLVTENVHKIWTIYPQSLARLNVPVGLRADMDDGEGGGVCVMCAKQLLKFIAKSQLRQAAAAGADTTPSRGL